MPKRPLLDPKEQAGLFKKTGDPEEQKISDPVKPRGIGLRASEWQRIDAIADELGTNVHALMLWALRDFVKRYEAGEIETMTKKTLPGL
jgi:hypothetical protein